METLTFNIYTLLNTRLCTRKLQKLVDNGLPLSILKSSKDEPSLIVVQCTLAVMTRFFVKCPWWVYDVELCRNDNTALF